MNIDAVTEQVRMSLEGVRHFLQDDGGDVELVDVCENGTVNVKFTGACAQCPMSVLTLRAGIERALIHDSVDVKRVEAVKG